MAKTKNIIAAALALVGVYFVYQHFSKKGLSNPFTAKEEDKKTSSSGSVSAAKDSYPLKKGSRGNNVTSLQQLILKIDKSLLPKYGADGDFGSETESAVQKLLNKKTIDGQNDLNALNLIFNKKTFPLVVPINPTANQMPKIDPFGK